jgi:hypothetical protein
MLEASRHYGRTGAQSIVRETSNSEGESLSSFGGYSPTHEVRCILEMSCLSNNGNLGRKSAGGGSLCRPKVCKPKPRNASAGAVLDVPMRKFNSGKIDDAARQNNAMQRQNEKERHVSSDDVRVLVGNGNAIELNFLSLSPVSSPFRGDNDGERDAASNVDDDNDDANGEIGSLSFHSSRMLFDHFGHAPAIDDDDDEGGGDFAFSTAISLLPPPRSGSPTLSMLAATPPSRAGNPIICNSPFLDPSIPDGAELGLLSVSPSPREASGHALLMAATSPRHLRYGRRYRSHSLGDRPTSYVA